MTKHDKVLIGALLTISVTIYLLSFLVYQQDTPRLAEISVNGNTVCKIDLNKQSNQLTKISGPLGISIAEVKSGAIRMKYSPCPDRCCVKTGWISRPGQVIACVPNLIVIKISPNENSVDTILR